MITEDYESDLWSCILDYIGEGDVNIDVFNRLIFDRLDEIIREAESISISGRIPYGEIEKEILDYLLTFNWDRLTQRKIKKLNNLFTLLHYRAYDCNPLRPRHRLETRKKRGINPGDILIYISLLDDIEQPYPVVQPPVNDIEQPDLVVQPLPDVFGPDPILQLPFDEFGSDPMVGPLDDLEQHDPLVKPLLDVLDYNLVVQPSVNELEQHDLVVQQPTDVFGPDPIVEPPVEVLSHDRMAGPVDEFGSNPMVGPVDDFEQHDPVLQQQNGEQQRNDASPTELDENTLNENRDANKAGSLNADTCHAQ